MNWDLRKGTIGLLSLGGLIIVYLLYTRYVQTPEIAMQTVDGTGIQELDGRSTGSGRIGNLEVGVVDGVTYEDRDDQGRVFRQWGFSTLWHRSNNVWEMKQPWVRLFMADANAVITADWGRVTLQSDQASAFPTDAVFSGNVVVQIQPRPGSSMPACRVKLDDISFSNSTSRFSSSGKIEFTSDKAHWTGRQAELLYDDLARRIEYFRIGHLDSLSMKVPKGQKPGTGSGGGEPAGAQQGSPNAGATSYQCLLRDNVQIQTTQEVISVRKALWLTDLAWSQSQGRPGSSPVTAPSQGSAARAKVGPDDSQEVSVVCDGPVVVTPTGTVIPAEPEDSAADPGPKAAGGPVAKNAARLVVSTLHYSARTGDAEVEGPVEADCLSRDFMAKENPGLIPAHLTAAQGGTYSSQVNRIVLEGPCLCTLVRTEAGVTEQGTLAAGRLIVDLLNDGERQLSVSTQAVKHLRAEGGVVELRMETLLADGKAAGLQASAAGPVASGARMVCTQLDMDVQPPDQVITALGPGTVWLNNSGTQKTGRLLDSHQPFYGLLSRFDTLQFFVADNRIVASGKRQPMWVDYFPIVDGRQDSHIRGEADSVQIDLARTGDQERDLATLVATGNVYYDDESHQFAAHKVTYDHRTQWMEMTGWDDQPCTADGILVSGINYNVKTKQGQTRPIGPVMGVR